MPISATGNKRASASGFTLVELMVVLAIMGIAATAVMLAMPEPRGRLRDEGETLAARMVAARDAAVIEARDFALTIDGTGYAFERRERTGWHAINEKPFRPERWPEGTAVQAGQGRIRFDTTGMADPVDVTLAREGARVVVRLGADGSIHVG